MRSRSRSPQEAGYTALSRARLDTRIYVAADDFDNDPSVDPSVDLAHQPSGREGSPAAASMDHWLRRSQGDHLAIDPQGRSREAQRIGQDD